MITRKLQYKKSQFVSLSSTITMLNCLIMPQNVVMGRSEGILFWLSGTLTYCVHFQWEILSALESGGGQTWGVDKRRHSICFIQKLIPLRVNISTQERKKNTKRASNFDLSQSNSTYITHVTKRYIISQLCFSCWRFTPTQLRTQKEHKFGCFTELQWLMWSQSRDVRVQHSTNEYNSRSQYSQQLFKLNNFHWWKMWLSLCFPNSYLISVNSTERLEAN